MRVITLARKPLKGSVAINVLENGAGALHIKATRIGTETRVNPPASNKAGGVSYHMAVRGMPADAEATQASGRWPANLILEHLPGCCRSGVKQVRGSNDTTGVWGSREGQAIYNDGWHDSTQKRQSYTNPDGTETVAAWVCVEGCPVAELDEQSGDRPVSGAARAGRPARGGDTGGATVSFGIEQGNGTLHDDSGGASRFYKQVGGVDSKRE